MVFTLKLKHSTSRSEKNKIKKNVLLKVTLMKVERKLLFRVANQNSNVPQNLPKKIIAINLLWVKIS